MPESFEVYTTHYLNWSGKKDDELLEAMQKQGFNLLVTSDRNLQHEQPIANYSVSLLVLEMPNNRFNTLKPHIQTIAQAISDLTSWTVQVKTVSCY